MPHRATRGVCIGVDRHLAAGDLVPADLTAAEVQFLANIGAIERLPADTTQVASKGSDAAPAPATDSETQSPAKPGKKEK